MSAICRLLMVASTALVGALRARQPRRRRSDHPGDTGESGMTTAEYAIGTIAACTFATLLIAVVRSPEIRTALVSIITRALALGQ